MVRCKAQRTLRGYQGQQPLAIEPKQLSMLRQVGFDALLDATVVGFPSRLYSSCSTWLLISRPRTRTTARTIKLNIKAP
jgi:hypothetical protein